MTVRPPHLAKWVRRGAYGIIAAGLAAFQSMCTTSSDTIPPPTQKVLQWRFECPDEEVAIQGFDTTGGGSTLVDTIHQIPLSEPIANIPEYHDCQRFIDSSGVYGSVYAIFAAFLLDTVSGGMTTPVATIYTPDGTYPSLGIMPGFNCLYLSKGADTWAAIMVPAGQGKQHSECTTPPAGPGTPLEVKEQQINSTTIFESGDFPPAARWDWDTVHTRQYIGIRCGPAWCEVGAPGFTPSAGYSGPLLTFDLITDLPLPPNATERVQRIKGWYDDQVLALPGGTGPSQVHGYLFPNPVLDTLNWREDVLTRYKDRGWLHVAWAVMDTDYAKWNLKKGKNKISFCYGSATPNSCDVPAGPQDPGSSVPLNSCTEDPSNNALRWWAKTESSTGVTYTCVRRMNHLAQLQALSSLKPGVDYRIPGAARWKFLTSDESTWMSCPTGCCTKH